MKTVDVSSKPETLRSARAYGRIRLKSQTLIAIKEGRLPKGDVLSACRVAGIMASKKTPELLPFCHPVSFEHVELEVKLGDDVLEVFSLVRGIQKTGYEMEALTAVSTALLTVYDMCKGVDDSMVIEEIKLLQKSGGKSQWSASLVGVGFKVIADGDLKGFIQDKLISLGAHPSEENYHVLLSTQPISFSTLWQVSDVINNKIFSLCPESLREGVRVGKVGCAFGIELQSDRCIISAFFESFGGMIARWLRDGEAL